MLFLQQVNQCAYMETWHTLSGCIFKPRFAILMQDYNEAMSALRISVEWLFGDVINSFKFLDYKKNLKIGLSSVGKMYVVCALLRNAITCLYGNTTSDYFGIEPPTLEQYFN